jgi:hypothetical protein
LVHVVPLHRGINAARPDLFIARFTFAAAPG